MPWSKGYVIINERAVSIRLTWIKVIVNANDILTECELRYLVGFKLCPSRWILHAPRGGDRLAKYALGIYGTQISASGL